MGLCKSVASRNRTYLSWQQWIVCESRTARRRAVSASPACFSTQVQLPTVVHRLRHTLQILYECFAEHNDFASSPRRETGTHQLLSPTLKTSGTGQAATSRKQESPELEGKNLSFRHLPAERVQSVTNASEAGRVLHRRMWWISSVVAARQAQKHASEWPKAPCKSSQPQRAALGQDTGRRRGLSMRPPCSQQSSAHAC